MSDDIMPPFTCGEPGVEYRPIPGHPGYLVGDDGSVWSCKRRGGWRRLKTANHSGYQLVALSVPNGGRTHPIGVHRLVLLAFAGPCPEGMEGCHDNGDRSDNHRSNLYWGTHLDNMQDAIRHRPDQALAAKRRLWRKNGFVVHLPPLHAKQLEKACAMTGRSMTGEVVVALANYLAREGVTVPQK